MFSRHVKYMNKPERTETRYSVSYFAEWKQTEISIHTAKVKVNLRHSFYFQFYTVALLIKYFCIQKNLH